jgi:hypothetical protein
MTSEHRQRMNIRAIRVTLASALRYVAPEQAGLCVDRARQLLEHARMEATSAAVLGDIDALDAELATTAAAHQRES